MSFSIGYFAFADRGALSSDLLIGNTTGSRSPKSLSKITHGLAYARGERNETLASYVVKVVV